MKVERKRECSPTYYFWVVRMRIGLICAFIIVIFVLFYIFEFLNNEHVCYYA